MSPSGDRTTEKAKACDFRRPEQPRARQKARAPGKPVPPTTRNSPTGGRGRGPVRRMPVAQVLSQATRTVYRHRAVRPACDGLTHRPTAPHPPRTQGREELRDQPQRTRG
ncbi:hypothetical protein GCM10010307_76570 [Streptomyces vastus]|uniref:Transposase n=1 Tax=Streptomyces vastus TaxID=285451 RepID=A0ABN3RVR2_9ACTN